MKNYPLTIEDAKKKMYGMWVGNPDGSRYVPGKCAYSLYSDYIEHQCRAKNGHGPSGLYCKTHAKWLIEWGVYRPEEQGGG